MRRVGDLIDQIDLHGQNRELVDELVALSTKYGLLTPYTSFLADERVQIYALGVNSDRAGEELQALGEVGGRSGVVQRRAKQQMMQAARAPNVQYEVEAHSSPALTPAPAGASAPQNSVAFEGREESLKGTRAGKVIARSGHGGNRWRGQSRFEGMMPAGRAGKDPAQQVGAISVEGKVRQIGSKTFYWKNNRWVDASVTPDEDKKATVVTQFSDEYFRLARTQKAEYNQYLSLTEPVTVKLDGTVYHIEPEKKATAP